MVMVEDVRWQNYSYPVSFFCVWWLVVSLATILDLLIGVKAMNDFTINIMFTRYKHFGKPKQYEYISNTFVRKRPLTSQMGVCFFQTKKIWSFIWGGQNIVVKKMTKKIFWIQISTYLLVKNICSLTQT